MTRLAHWTYQPAASRPQLEVLERREMPAGLLPGPSAGASAPGQLNEWSQTLQQAATLPGARVLFLGDSITRGFAHTPYFSQFMAPLGGVGLGFSGAGTAELLALVRTGRVAALHPAVIVLEIGSANILKGQLGVATAQGVKAIVSELLRQLPSTRVLVEGALPLGGSVSSRFALEGAQFNATLAAAFSETSFQRRVKFLDFGQLFVAANGTSLRSLRNDGIHPTLAGYAIFTAVLYPAIISSLSSSG